LDNNQSLINVVPEPSEETSSSQPHSSFDSKNESEVDRTSTKIYANTHSYFSFRIVDPLSIVWKNTTVALFLNVHSPLKMKNCLDTIVSSAKNSTRLAHKSKIPLKLSRLSTEERHEILFHYVPMHQHAGIFEKFHIKLGKGLTLSFTKKAIKRRVTIQKGVVLG